MKFSKMLKPSATVAAERGRGGRGGLHFFSSHNAFGDGCGAD
jgi:hypothetical protein